MLKQVTLLFLLSALAPIAWADASCAKVDLQSSLSAYIKNHSKKFPSTQDSPEPETTLDMIRDGLQDKIVTLLEVHTSTPPIRWIGIGWQGPIGGILIAVDCQGVLLDGSSDGEVERLNSGPVLPGAGATVLAEYTDATGTGYLHKSVSLYGIKDNKVVVFWTHELEKSEYELDLDGVSTKYKLISATADKLEITGDVETFPSIMGPDGSDWANKPSKVEHTHEDFCWDPHKSYFEPCPKG